MRSFVAGALTVVGLAVLAVSAIAQAQEIWVKAIRTSPNWSSYPCKDWVITTACSAVKVNADSAALPPVVRLEDIIHYTDKDGATQRFRIEAINFYQFDKDVYEKKTLVARKGETSCFLFDSTKAYRSMDHLSKIVVKGCVPLQ